MTEIIRDYKRRYALDALGNHITIGDRVRAVTDKYGITNRENNYIGIVEKINYISGDNSILVRSIGEYPFTTRTTFAVDSRDFEIVCHKEHAIDALSYCVNDDLSTQSFFLHFMPNIKDVIINPPATIVIWEDDTKTVVKCGEGETFDPEKGLAMAISKKVLGNKYMWHGKFNKWLKKYNKEVQNANKDDKK